MLFPCGERVFPSRYLYRFCGGFQRNINLNIFSFFKSPQLLIFILLNYEYLCCTSRYREVISFSINLFTRSSHEITKSFHAKEEKGFHFSHNCYTIQQSANLHLLKIMWHGCNLYHNNNLSSLVIVKCWLISENGVRQARRFL